MQYSHSRVESFKGCPYKYKLRYVDKLKTILNQDANNALICGNTIHLGAEKDLKVALKFYKSNYYIMSDLNINEIIKFEYLIPKLKELLLDINIYAQEYLISTHRFRGIVDLITSNTDGTVDVFDFKYSNAIEHYMESPQLHIYKYFLEKQGFKVRKLGFIFIPKISIRQKKEEDLYQFRKRLMEELKKSEINLLEVPYNPNKVIEFMDSIIDTKEVKEFKKNPTRLCDWCEYQKYCFEGVDYMILPSTERREISEVSKKVMWWYGAPFSGKTTLANKFPDPLMLNTDGNIKFVDAPFLPIKDEVVVEGRMTKRTLAWGIFKEVIEELEKKQNDFKTIIVDLLEDTYEHCRLYMYDKLGIEHESDNSFKAWDMVRTEFLSTLKRLMNLDYENIILISHEDMSKDVTKKSGDKVTRIAPNIQEKAANKIAGMVDIVARVIAEGDERFMDFKPSEVIFGGGRLTVESNRIPLEYKALMKVYDEANAGKKEPKKEKTKVEDKKEEEVKETTLDETVDEPKEESTKEIKEEKPVEETKEEKPKRRRRRKEEK
ncbi:AAA family ATPase [Clostridium botulinum]|uniref:AAA family ATPase n=1 Tax=Clostridium botulinum TaxID=1491 RepID=UPI000467EB47|nr:AAA family ATPase [Clostridium botulinum]APQ72891.1 AAA domain protein [Clostridium botulinum]